VFPSFEIGGAQARLATLAEGFGSAAVHGVVSLEKNFDAAGIMPPCARLSRLAAPAAGSLPARLVAYARMITRLRPDVLLTYNWGAMEFALANHLSGRPHLHLEDGFGPGEARRQFARRIWARRLALRGVDVLVPSETLRAIAAESWRIPPARLHYVPNGVHAPRGPVRSLEALGVRLPAARVKIAWSGALRPEKNPLRLLQAFAPLCDRAVLVIIGDGPERARLAAAAEALGVSGSVRLLGRRSDAREIVSRCDLFALSSDTEQAPLAVLEAMSAGLPIASVDVGDVRRMLARENGPMVTAPTAAALGDALARLVADPGLRRAVGRANQARAAAAYGADAMVRAHRHILETLAARGR
jgi:glycosyltransferase involved in cell wall biosynthesis